MQVIATPKPDVRVRKPNGEILLASGERVERTTFWLRREIDGDVDLTALPVADAGEADISTPAPAKRTK